MTSALHYLDLTELSRRIHARELSPVEATTAQLTRIERLDGRLKSYAHMMAEAALIQARTAEAEIMRGEIRGPLHGVPIAVKDLCWTQGVPSAAGMTIYKDFRPTEDATVVRKLNAAGAIILGKLQLTEGAWAEHHPQIPAPVNPWNAAHWSGASSSGSGVATAAGLCYGSLGSDTGGEEGYGGARLMIADGLIDADPKPDGAFALHIAPHIRAGAILGKPGTMLASADTWTIQIKGRGGHASMPHHAVDPIPVAFEIGLALHAMVTRRIDAFDPVVLTCSKITAGTANNVIPETVEMTGTVRATSETAREKAQEGISRIASNIAAAHLCRAEITIRRGYPVTVNDDGFVDFARAVATDLVGAGNYLDSKAPIMGAEDFSYVLQRIPGCMMFLGVMPEGRDASELLAPCHSNRMILNEASMAVGIAMHASIAHRFLAQGTAC